MQPNFFSNTAEIVLAVLLLTAIVLAVVELGPTAVARWF